MERIRAFAPPAFAQGAISASLRFSSLIRYDLLLLGPHKHYSGDDWGSKRMAELDAKTVQRFHEAKPGTLYLDHLLDRAAGHELTAVERSARMREIAHYLLEIAINSAR